MVADQLTPRTKPTGPETMSDLRAALPVLVITVAAGAVVRLAGLSDYRLSSDDLLHLIIAYRAGLADVFHESLVQFHPPLIYFVLHLMARLSRHELFLRSVSLVPGIITIIVFFFWGKRYRGLITGAVAALITAFAFGPVILSQVVRAYSMLMLLEALALAALTDYFVSRDHRRPYLYSGALTLAGCFHYSAAIPAAAAASAWVLWALRQKTGPAEIKKILAAHLAPALVMAGFAGSHVYRIYAQGAFAEVRQMYWRELFPAAPAEWLENARGLADYLFFPGAGPVMMVLVVIGAGSQIKRSRPELAVIAFLSLALTLVLAAFKAYPFAGSRHCVFLFAPLAILTGAGVEAVIEAVGQRLARYPWGSVRNRSAAAGVVFPLTVIGLFYIVEYRERGYRPAARGEFTALREDYDRVVGALWEKVGADDVVIMDYQTYVYFKVRDMGLRLTEVTDRVRRFPLRGPAGTYDGFVFTDWESFDPEQLAQLFQNLSYNLTYRGGRRVWFIQIGNTAFNPVSAGFPPPDQIGERVITPTATLVGYDGNIIYFK